MRGHVCVCTRAAAEATPRITEREGGRGNLKNRKPAFPPQRKKKKTQRKKKTAEDQMRKNLQNQEEEVYTRHTIPNLRRIPTEGTDGFSFSPADWLWTHCGY